MGRGDMLPVATEQAIKLLDQQPKGFFMMVEGSQIDWGCHQNNTDYVVTEVLDFDMAVGKALEFAQKDGETLVVITGDHETGGMALTAGDFRTGKVEAVYGTEDHTAVMIPVFAFGPGAELFSGIYENTDIFRKMKEALGL
jgi:alkaline phosphatase